MGAAPFYRGRWNFIGHDVVSEAVITPEMLDHYLAPFEGVPVLFVGIRCPLEEVERRCPRSTSRSMRTVDTSVLGPAEVAELIVAALTGPPVPPAFDRLRTRFPDQG
ncbi:phosphotransferase-like protein [Nonomuraea zeae]|uniref:Uncharacterized protein n=1 Tax=Nonomuraea zeae TaxID=1642303 RepID=A0A5S4GPE7_9ACTN|nr:hypothetical protein [Nonomuraea zeae]TMR34642.1 hypothetical protein ETD85_16070 [Nonomuraea zeae]